jgi:hypothetical protein
MLTEARRRTRQIDTLYREWSRNRTDAERLRRLHATISECLKGDAGGKEGRPRKRGKAARG